MVGRKQVPSQVEWHLDVTVQLSTLGIGLSSSTLGPLICKTGREQRDGSPDGERKPCLAALGLPQWRELRPAAGAHRAAGPSRVVGAEVRSCFTTWLSDLGSVTYPLGAASFY